MRFCYRVTTFAALIFGLMPALPAVAGEGGGWTPDYSAMAADPETKNYISHAESPLGGNCCEWADGFMYGKPYRFYRGYGSNGPTETTRRVVLHAWRAKSDGYYAVVWDYIVTGELVELKANYQAFAPGNPTGTPIVWLWVNDDDKLEIRCYGGEPQS